jgi:MFS family permease
MTITKNAILENVFKNLRVKMNPKIVMSFRRNLVIWIIANIFYLYEVALRVSPSVMTDSLMTHYAITSSMLGVLISIFYYSYTFLQLPCGLILDKLGPRNLIVLSVISSVVGSVLFALTNNTAVAMLGRCLVGAGGSCAFISCLQIGSVLFHKKYFALLAGVTNMMGTFGSLCAGFPVAKSVNAIGWEKTIYALATIGVEIAKCAFYLIPKTVKTSDSISNKSFKSILYKVICNKQIIIIGIVGGFMYLPISAFCELWAVPFFVAKYGVDNETASLVSSVLFIGFAAGSIPLAIIAKKVNGYMKTMRFSIICVTLLFIPLIYVDNIYASFAIVFAIGVFSAAEVLAFTCAKNNESIENSGTTIALANALVMLTGSIFQPALGMLLDFFWTGKLSEGGMRIYEISSYQKAILMLPICFVAAYILSLFAKETIGAEK